MHCSEMRGGSGTSTNLPFQTARIERRTSRVCVRLGAEDVQGRQVSTSRRSFGEDVGGIDEQRELVKDSLYRPRYLEQLSHPAGRGRRWLRAWRFMLVEDIVIGRHFQSPCRAWEEIEARGAHVFFDARGLVLDPAPTLLDPAAGASTHASLHVLVAMYTENGYRLLYDTFLLNVS